MTMKILATTDFSTRSQRAVRRAGLIARETGSEITLLHVVDDDRPPHFVDTEIREAERYLVEQIGTLAELKGLTANSLVAVGDAFDGILGAAKSIGANLIVMGSHRRQILWDIFIGTTIERVIRMGTFPVLMASNEAAHPYRRAAAAVDMTAPSMNALRTVKSLEFLTQADITVIHGVQSSAKGKMSQAGVDINRINAHVEGELLTTKSELQDYFRIHGFDVERWPLRIEEGAPIEVISRFVKAAAPDLLIMGTHARKGIARAFWGSVTELVLSSVNTDVLVVPPAG
jgi:nucleotide-binding universal stress UspA family protein